MGIKNIKATEKPTLVRLISSLYLYGMPNFPAAKGDSHV